MKKLKLLPSVLMLALCIGILGIGIYAASPTNNVITGTITVNAANAGIKVEVFKGTDTSVDPIGEDEGRTQTKIELKDENAIEIDASNALSLEDVAPAVYTIKLSTTSTHKFVVDTETIQLLNGKVTSTQETLQDAIIITKNHQVNTETQIDGETGLAYFTKDTPYVITSSIKLGKLPEQEFAADLNIVLDVHKLTDWTAAGNFGINGVDYLHYGSYPQTLAATFETEEEITGYTKIANETFGGYDVATKTFVQRDVYTKDGEIDGTKYVLLTSETKWNAALSERITTASKKLFKIEPLKWNILERNQTTGKAKLMCDTVVEGVYFQQYYSNNYATDADGARLQENGKDAYANNYNVSTLRTYLTETFYTGAFNTAEEVLILEELVDNTNSTETGEEPNTYSCQDTYDKVFALSYQEVFNTNYKFSDDPDAFDMQRIATSSDFAISTGVATFTMEAAEATFGTTDKQALMGFIESELGMTGYAAEKFYASFLNSGYWWLRSPHASLASRARFVNGYGLVHYYNANSGNPGCVPALLLGL